ncbi:hypothetical protein THRCLA_06198 [Thraustotheca clavata]|uniref:LicD/FKTN/FKRP nucleotidyltransferase domain-containing protein n=1 Tax=Thraustotheca clavata TaxID=74557 RepID=A0A1V9ZQ83_9STRA|nr:hypothetical protein THRCLA_06198 [Thraustotheca clavata]
MEFVKNDACWSRAQVQNILHNLTVTFIEILEKHEIDYWLDSGTLLGAVRSQGVLPLDYDADFGLTKESMDKLRNTAVELPENYVLWILYSPIHPWSHRDDALPGRWVHTQSGLYIDLFEFNLHPNVRREYTETLDFSDESKLDLFSSVIDQVAPGMNREKAESIETSGELKVTYTTVEDMIAPIKSICWDGCAECPKSSFFQIPRSWANCPAKPHNYLKMLYGPNYMIPDRH